MGGRLGGWVVIRIKGDTEYIQYNPKRGVAWVGSGRAGVSAARDGGFERRGLARHGTGRLEGGKPRS